MTRARALALLLLAPLAARAQTAAPPGLHPEVPLLDAAGASVLETGEPVSTARTCGGCHDVEAIGRAYHFQVGRDEPARAGRPWDAGPGLLGRWDPLRWGLVGEAAGGRFDLGLADWIRREADRHPGGGPAWTDRARAPLALRRAGGALDPETHARGEGVHITT